MSYAHSLSGLSLHEEISDTIVRACLGIDTNDKALWESAWATEDPDISLTTSGTDLKGMENINKYCFDNVGPMDTHHLTTGIRIDVKEGANIAHMTANALNQHYAPGEGLEANAKHLLVGSRYDIQVIKESGGQWKIKSWNLNVIWREGDRSVMKRQG
jgi:hypothetical protein